MPFLRKPSVSPLPAPSSGCPEASTPSGTPGGHTVARLASATADTWRAAWARERQTRLQLERDIVAVRDDLSRALAELAGTQEGESRARHEARHDGLTSLPNRTAFLERLHDALAGPAPQRESLAVLYLDLDGFKPINDQHGHHVGDELLRIVAARLERALRVEDFVSRLGGDEFGCLLTGLPPGRESLSHLACKLYDAVTAPSKLGSLELTVAVSIGIASCPLDGDSADVLLRHADAAMYRAKRLRSGYAFFDPHVDTLYSTDIAGFDAPSAR